MWQNCKTEEANSSTDRRKDDSGSYLRGRVFQEFLSEALYILLSVISPGHKIFPGPSVSSVFDFVQYRFPSKLQKGKRSVGF